MQKSWRSVDSIIDNDSNLNWRNLINKSILTRLNWTCFFNLLSDNSENKRNTWTKISFQFLKISLDSQSSSYGVKLEVGCMVAIPEIDSYVSIKAILLYSLNVVDSPPFTRSPSTIYLESRMYLIGLPIPLSPSTATMLQTKSPILLFSGSLVTGGAEKNEFVTLRLNQMMDGGLILPTCFQMIIFP